MSGGSPHRDALADLAHQAGALARRVLESRWPGITAPVDGGPAAGTGAAPVRGAATGVPPIAAAAAVRNASPTGTPAWNSIEEIARAVGSCTQCRLHATRTKTVPGEGNPRAALVFVGEGPGADEDRQGRPFVGRAGQLLDRMIVAMGLKRDEVFIANVVKCRPPGNRDPLPDEIDACRPYLLGQLDLIRPQIICALGKFSAQTLLETKESISRLRGQFHDFRGTALMPTFHPSYLLRNAKDKDLAWQDLQQIMARLGLPLPAVRSAEASR